jgi:hypothetical protein
MSYSPGDRVTAARVAHQAALVDLLWAGLDSGFTMLRTANIETGYDPDHCRAALAKVCVLLDTIRRLAVRIDDPGECKHIYKRTDELESALIAFPV